MISSYSLFSHFILQSIPEETSTPIAAPEQPPNEERPQINQNVLMSPGILLMECKAFQWKYPGGGQSKSRRNSIHNMNK